ncbi:hypothetical protein C2S53_019592 [Perilla frutescens var. hirtella]|uniref:Uncharacterized protein n=1 Tax=Perilla frutescens var. hirtella TaxID=608512 RepID=A0AAD4NV97_PERFH|nr:hypothetical protein C2S53_019592 [Perilla frutescens var. hirtella]KAH6761178.1 hypothetical protein C2S51_018127 [Perilla frutescens var. frutescens]
MRLIGAIAKHKINIMIDSGSTLSFINEATTKILGCVLENVRPLMVKVANGNRMMSTTRVNHFRWTMQNHNFTYSPKVLATEGYDLILGGDWLKSCTPFKLDYDKMTFIVTVAGTKFKDAYEDGDPQLGALVQEFGDVLEKPNGFSLSMGTSLDFTTTYQPNQMAKLRGHYGYPPSLHSLDPYLHTTYLEVKDLVSQRRKLMQEFKENLMPSQHQMKLYADMERQEREFQRVCIGPKATTSPQLSEVDVHGTFLVQPTKMKDHRVISRSCSDAHHFLVEGGDSDEGEESWESKAYLYRKFPNFDPWGQVSQNGREIVMNCGVWIEEEDVASKDLTFEKQMGVMALSICGQGEKEENVFEKMKLLKRIRKTSTR